MELSPSMTFPAASSAIETVSTLWSMNPFGGHSGSDRTSTAVVEFTLRDSGSGADVPIIAKDNGSSLPIHFWVEMAPGMYRRVSVGVSASRILSVSAADWTDSHHR